MEGNFAVEMANGVLSYGRGRKTSRILKKVSLKVPRGVIYGLLGPSGCGKTTLLSTIVGQLDLTSGSVKVFGKKPGSKGSLVPGRGIGYMPQDLALFPEFTIEESLMYFGRLHGLDELSIVNRISFLLEFLDLPSKTRLVMNLSGGQQRRVSFAVALIHSPPLLILDEPTVGVDPVLRQAIWDHLVHLTTKEAISVIITTHYIEEASQAGMVGLLRKGRLLMEGSPKELLEKYGVSTLEDCFLQICEFDSLDNNESNDVEDVVLYSVTDDSSADDKKTSKVTIAIKGIDNHQFLDDQCCISSDRTSQNESAFPEVIIPKGNAYKPQAEKYYSYVCKKQTSPGFLSNVSTLFKKNITRLSRNLPVVIFQFVLPSILVVLLCVTIGQYPFNITVAIVNDENPAFLSQFYLDSLDKTTIVQDHFYDLNEAIQSVKDGYSWGVVHFSHNFTSALYARMEGGLSADNYTITSSTIKVYLDMSNIQVAFSVHKALMENFKEFSKELLDISGASPRVAELPLSVQQPIYGTLDVSFTEFIAPGVILSITYILAVGLTALTFVEERRTGLYARSCIAGVTSSEVLLSHIFTQFFVLVVQVSGALIFTFLVFNVPSRGSFILVVVLTLLQGVCGMAYGLVISTLVKNESSVIMIAMGSFYPNITLSGIIWPIEGMPHFVRYLSYCMPQTLAVEAIRDVLSKGWGLNNVWPGFLMTLAWTVLFMFIAAALSKFKR